MNAVIVADNLTKRYGAFTAVDGVSFAVEAGTICGLLGPNGAGKTTVLECLAGLRPPDGGTIQVARKRVGVALQTTALQDRITPREALRLFGAFYRVGPPADALLERFVLTGQSDAPFASLSAGQRQRLALALAFVNDPEVLVLDEPTAGLDPPSRRELHGEIRRLRDEGRTVLLSTHDLAEAHALCDRLVILRGGRVAAWGRPEELIARYAAGSLEEAFVEIMREGAEQREASEVNGNQWRPEVAIHLRMTKETRFPWRGLGQHLLLTLRLNFRHRAPLVYGYFVPALFLLAFGSVFRGGTPPLLAEMGQLLTITILGGACFGLPTALVAERERGGWRRYRLLPASAWALVVSTSVARVLLVGSAAGLQLGLAWAIYGTPGPALPGQFLVAFGAVCFAFLGGGLVIAMLADGVPAVQAIGQCVFLPMIIIGGVGVPLGTLPAWAQHVAGFLPGHYAVAALDACLRPAGGGLAAAKFALVALGVIGAAAFVAGGGLFRWDAGPRRLGRGARGWIGLALGAWVLVGVANEWGQAHPTKLETQARVDVRDGALLTEPWRGVTEAQIAAISFGDLTPDDSYYVPVAPSLEGLDADTKSRLDGIEDTLAYWPPGREGPRDQRVRNLLSVCAVADLTQDRNEGEIALIVFGQIRRAVPAGDLPKVLAWIILHPADGQVRLEMAEFGIRAAPEERVARERCAAYAKKLLWRLRREGS